MQYYRVNNVCSLYLLQTLFSTLIKKEVFLQENNEEKKVISSPVKKRTDNDVIKTVNSRVAKVIDGMIDVYCNVCSCCNAFFRMMRTSLRTT